MFRRALLAAATTAALILSPVTAEPARSAAVTAADLPQLLRVEMPDTAHKYERAAFEHWIDADGDGCNTRYEVLIDESSTPVTRTERCTLTGGTWVSPYDGLTAASPAGIEIDHVVALAEAWRSGAWAWTPQQRRDFANDLGVPYALTAASSASNQAKADKDPAQWMPTNGAYRCEFVTSWALIKYRWSLTIDAAEQTALADALSGECGAAEITLPATMVAAHSPAPSPEPITFPAGGSRLSGADRFDTAIAVSKKSPAGVDAVFVATSANFPDALAAAAAAAKLGGPLLLTRSASIPAKVLEEIRRLRPRQIFIAGGSSVVSDSVRRALAALAPVERLGGSSRYETGQRLIERAFSSAEHALIATGRSFPDALAATGAAGARSAPVVLVNGTSSSLPSSILSMLDRLGVKSVTIVGGTGAVSSGIEAQLRRTHSTTRVGGADRYTTAANINTAYFGGTAPPLAFVATGQHFPDALAGAALAGRLKSPVYITLAGCVPAASRESLAALHVPSTVALGGSSVVSNTALANTGCLSAATPRISGSTIVSSTLSAQPGSWTSGTSFRYQWLANGAALSGATRSTFTLTSGLVGKRISVRVTGTKAGYTTRTITSGATAPVVRASTPPPSRPSSTTPIAGTWNCPSWALIKGNASSMIYHVPGGAYYDRTNPERCFSTESAAQAAGYRKSKR